jgi:hypothetical protein
MKRKVDKNDVCVVIEGPRWADCTFHAQWLLAAAKAQALWAFALEQEQGQGDLHKFVGRLGYYPSFEIGAFLLLKRFKLKKPSLSVKQATTIT